MIYDFSRMGQCPTRPHKPGPPGATPGSATCSPRMCRPGFSWNRDVGEGVWGLLV